MRRRPRSRRRRRKPRERFGSAELFVTQYSWMAKHEPQTSDSQKSGRTRRTPRATRDSTARRCAPPRGLPDTEEPDEVEAVRGEAVELSGRDVVERCLSRERGESSESRARVLTGRVLDSRRRHASTRQPPRRRDCFHGARMSDRVHASVLDQSLIGARAPRRYRCSSEDLRNHHRQPEDFEASMIASGAAAAIVFRSRTLHLRHFSSVVTALRICAEVGAHVAHYRRDLFRVSRPLNQGIPAFPYITMTTG